MRKNAPDIPQWGIVVNKALKELHAQKVINFTKIGTNKKECGPQQSAFAQFTGTQTAILRGLINEGMKPRPENRASSSNSSANDMPQSENLIARLAHLAIDVSYKPLLGTFLGHPMQRKGTLLLHVKFSIILASVGLLSTIPVRWGVFYRAL